jgi:uncharacterized LabA/DUF88 family protein
MALRTNVYIDAFNVYYGCTRNTPYRWLNLARLCEMMLPSNDIHQIKVFTGKVKGRPHDPDQPARQQIYFRALETIPNLTLIYGNFLTHRRMMPRAESLASGELEYVEVLVTQEKGSDVNLASHMLYDAFVDAYDIAVILSNDSDLAEPVKILRVQMKKKVGILNPQINRPEYRDAQGKIDPEKIKFSFELRRYAIFYKALTEEALQQSQFPDTLTDRKGAFHKPPSW